MRVLGALLYGGNSSRFGSDKALALFRGRPLIDHTLERLARQTEDIVICGRALPGFHCLNDRPAQQLGPLAGLNAALHTAKDAGYDAVLSAPCDVPLLPLELHDRLAPHAPSYVAQLPVIGLWPTSLADALDGFILRDLPRSVRAFAHEVNAFAVTLSITPMNINTPADLAALTCDDGC
jgi:molybdenum cofactor guanylyltransferase